MTVYDADVSAKYSNLYQMCENIPVNKMMTAISQANCVKPTPKPTPAPTKPLVVTRFVLGPSMTTKRGGLAAVVFDNKVYAIGGYNGNGFLNSVEMFQWHVLDARAEHDHQEMGFGGGCV